MKRFNDNKYYETSKFNHFWKFNKTALNVSYNDVLKSLTDFKNVVLPHDYLIYQVNDLYENSIGWYFKEFELDNLKQFKYFLNFDGIYMDSTIYINDKEVFEWKNGYSAFEFEINDYCIEGNNKIVVKVNHEAPNSRWYSGAGIYRDVFLIKKSLNHISTNGIYISTNVDTKEVYIKSEFNLLENASIQYSILLNDDLIKLEKYDVKSYIHEAIIKLDDISLWSPDRPTLYKLKADLITNETIVDSVINSFGFKDIVMSNKGLFINGIHSKLNGVCEHHDLGALGSAMNRKVLKNRILALKDMGVNAIRTAHTIPAKELMELADELGILIVSEAFDMWLLPKTTYDYSRFFNEWLEKDVESWIKRDRNHVSLLMWSIGNEIYDTHVSAEGLDTANRIKNLVIKYDPRLNGKITFGSNFLFGENTQNVANELKYVGYNYLEKLYLDHHVKYDDWIIYGSETSSIVKSRGIYHFPLDELILSHEDKQCSSLGNSLTSWGSKSLEDSMIIDRDTKFSLGQFLWTGHDYIGEPTPYDTKNSYFGQIDTAGFKKDSFYVHKASWSKEHVLHLFPYWNFNKDELIDVRVATNASFIELYLNNKLIDTKELNIRIDKNIIPTFKVKYEPGELKVIAYDSNRKYLSEVSNKTFSDPAKLRVTLLEDKLKANGEDLTEIIIESIDKDGNLVVDDNQDILIEVSSKGRLLGLDNGDSTDYTEYKGNIRPMFSGKLKAYIGSMYETGTITVKIVSKYLKEEIINIEVTKDILDYESNEMSNRKDVIRNHEITYYENKLDFIPIRKIYLNSKDRVLTKENNNLIIDINVLPSNANKEDIKWSIVNRKGLPVSYAMIHEKESKYVLEGLEDGEFVLRAFVNNNKNHPTVISELLFKAEGIGTSYKNPFELIRSGLYDSSYGEVKSGIEHGIATSNEDRTEVIYNNINFKNNVSKNITLSVFSFDTAPLWVDIYYKKPEENEFNYLQRLNYFKETIWDVYIEQSFILDKELTHNLDIKLVFERFVHFKGFYFKKESDNNREISILEANTYYGDSYNIEEFGFTEIGNNTTFIFEQLEFDKEVHELSINGLALKNDNSIRLILTDVFNNSETIQIEFIKDVKYNTQTYNIKPLLGKYKVEFIFLPGSNFNFKTFKFT